MLTSSQTQKSKQWFYSEYYVMKKAVKKSCTEWRVNGNAASRDCHQLPETEAAEEEPVRRQHDQRTHIKSGISGS